ncbi:VPS4-associated protein 1 [Trichophaea hybrida]|nr:VPS4-associated protein 1 [Trichophaea hybrida]
MSHPPKNLYHHRRVADASAKPCFVCYRPATSVLITPDQSDFFYTCPGHLQDRGFCSPVEPTPVEPTPEEVERRKKEEVERVKREYEERMKRKKEKEKEKEKKDDKKDDKDKDKNKDKVKDDKDKDKDKDEGEVKEKKPEEPPRTFTLHKKIYDLRVMRIRQREQAKRHQERLKNPSLFPSVPKGFPGGL